MSKKSIATIYYSLLGLLLLTQVIYTVYQSSLIVSHGIKQRRLEQQQAVLLKQKHHLQSQLAQQRSLLQYTENNQLTQYQDIVQPIVITAHSNLAVAQ